MIQLIIVCFSALFCCVLSELSSKNEITIDGKIGYINKDKFFYFLCSLILAGFVGLRTRGNDTYAYRNMYESLPIGIEVFHYVKFDNIASAPGLIFIASLFRCIGASTQTFLMAIAIFTNFSYLWFIRQYSNNRLFSVFLFISMGGYGLTMAALKQTTAIGILMIATDQLIKRREGRFLIFTIIAMLFHPYSFIYIVFLYLFFKPWTKRTGILLCGTIVVAPVLRFFMGGIMDLTELLGYNYSGSEFTGQGVNILRVLVVWVPLILSFYLRYIIQIKDNAKMDFMINASMICSMIMFIGLFGTANYFARLANYFLIFQTISLPYLIGLMPRTSRDFITGIAIVLFFIFFIVENRIHGGFSNNYSFMSLIDFFGHLWESR